MHKHGNTTNVLTTEQKGFLKAKRYYFTCYLQVAIFAETTEPIYDPKIPLMYSKGPLASILFAQEPTEHTSESGTVQSTNTAIVVL